MPVELKSASDLSLLQISLDYFDIHSLAVRHVLWFLTEGIITQGHVFVDRWPDFTLVCTIFTSGQFISESLFDFDVAYFCQSTATDTDFEQFLRDLASVRGWTNGRSLYAQSVLESRLDSLRRVLDNYGKLETYGQYVLYTGMESSNLSQYQERLRILAASLPPDLEADTLRASDIDKVISGWSYGPPGMIPSYFEWLIDKFPSTCLRKNGKLVAWAATYNYGAIAHLYIDPEYRGRGLSEYMWLSIAIKLGQFSPVQVFFDVAPGNAVSERSSMKAFKLDHKKGHEIITWLFFYNREQFVRK